MKFSDYPLAPQLKQNIDRLGWRRPTDIQYRAIRPVLEGEDVLAVAQTGTGKTAAFAIPAIQKIMELKARQRRETGISCLLLAPTRELVQQLTGVFESLGRGTGVRVLAVVGGAEIEPQISGLTRELDVLLTTPGRMYDLLGRKLLRLDRVDTLIIDEADQMLERGFIEDIRGILGHLRPHRQTLFFSATIDDAIKKLAYSLVRNPIRIQVSPKDPVSKNIDHAVVFIDQDDKRHFLERFVKEHPAAKVLIFARTQVRCQRVARAMDRVGLPTLTLYGELEQSEREAALLAFRRDERRLLVATDLSARGIDLPDVTHVVNYDVPEAPEMYVHRIGRTGRGKRRGTAYTFCAPHERDALKAVERYTGYAIDVVALDKGEYRQTLDIALEDKMDLQQLMQQAEEVLGKRKKKRKGHKK